MHSKLVGSTLIKHMDYWALSFYFSLYPSHSKNNMRHHFPKEMETVLKGNVLKLFTNKFTGLELTGKMKSNKIS